MPGTYSGGLLESGKAFALGRERKALVPTHELEVGRVVLGCQDGRGKLHAVGGSQIMRSKQAFGVHLQAIHGLDQMPGRAQTLEPSEGLCDFRLADLGGPLETRESRGTLDFGSPPSDHVLLARTEFKINAVPVHWTLLFIPDAESMAILPKLLRGSHAGH